jgi:hypothetical protein
MPVDPPLPRGNTEYQRRQAVQLRKAALRGSRAAAKRVAAVFGDRVTERLTEDDARHVIAREHGYDDWEAFEGDLGAGKPAARQVMRLTSLEAVPDYEQRARRLQAELAAGDDDAIRRVRGHLRQYADTSDTELAGKPLPLNEAQLVVAHEYGFPTWGDLAEEVERIRQERVTPEDPAVAMALQVIHQGDAGELQALLKREPALVNGRTNCGETLLGMIAQPNALGFPVGRELGVARACVEALVNAGTDLEGPLTLAAAHDRLELVNVLLESGARADAVDKQYGLTPLQAAVYHGSTAAGDALAKVAVVPDALYVAAGAGRVDLLERWFDGDGNLRSEAFQERLNLADVGWPPSAPPKDDPADVLGEAFTMACYNGRLKAAEWLLAHGADIDAAPYLNTTGLHFAVWAGQQAMVDWLVEKGADVSIRDRQHDGTPLEWAQYVAGRNEQGPTILGALERQAA